jgi:hypothetical protein
MKLCKVYREHSRKGTYGHEYAPKDLGAVEKEIRGLNGQTNTLVMFFIDDNKNLAVGGGNDKKYNIEVTIGITGPFFTLVERDSESSQSEVELIVGGQAAPFDPHQVVDFDTALQAASYWAENGELDPSLSWEQH